MKVRLRGWAKRHPRWALVLLYTTTPLLLAAVLCDVLGALAEEVRESWEKNGGYFRDARDAIISHIRSVKNEIR